MDGVSLPASVPPARSAIDRFRSNSDIVFSRKGMPDLLYKDLIATYGSSLSGRSSLEDDMVWHLVPSDELTRFRRYALEALQQAKVYLIDHSL